MFFAGAGEVEFTGISQDVKFLFGIHIVNYRPDRLRFHRKNSQNISRFFSMSELDVSRYFSLRIIDVSPYFSLRGGKSVFGHFLSKVGHLLI